MWESIKSRHIIEVLIVALLLILSFLFLYFVNPSKIPFKAFSWSGLFSVVMTLFVVAIFMERSVEAILIPIRAPDRQKIEQELKKLKENTEAENQEKILDKENELARYKLNTAQRAYWLSFAFGLFISLVGVRTLGGLVDTEQFPEFANSTQYWFFSFADVVLTGGVIAGGSAAIDKIARAISSFLNLKSDMEQVALMPKQPEATGPTAATAHSQ